MKRKERLEKLCNIINDITMVKYTLTEIDDPYGDVKYMYEKTDKASKNCEALFKDMQKEVTFTKGEVALILDCLLKRQSELTFITDCIFEEYNPLCIKRAENQWEQVTSIIEKIQNKLK